MSHPGSSTTLVKRPASPVWRWKPRIQYHSASQDGCPMSPNFLLGPIASTKLHAPFLKERRTRGLVWGSVQEIRGVCVGVAGALHGLNKMGRSPFQCFLFRAKPRRSRTLTRRANDAKDLQLSGPFLEIFSKSSNHRQASTLPLAWANTPKVSGRYYLRDESQPICISNLRPNRALSPPAALRRLSAHVFPTASHR